MAEPLPAPTPRRVQAVKVLAVDDNAANLKLIAAMLKEMVSQVEVCKNGKEAVLVQSNGSEAVPGKINNSGRLQQGARGATGTIYFQCGASEPVVSATASSDRYETSRFQSASSE